MKIKMPWFILLVFFVFSRENLFAQNANLDYHANRSIEIAASGVLIVMIPYQSVLKSTIAQLEANKKDPRNEKIIRKQIQDQERFNQLWIEALQKHYTFGSYAVMYDTAFDSFRKSPDIRFFINRSADSIRLVKNNLSNYLIMKKGTTNGQKLEALVIADENFKNLTPPFPYAERLRKNWYPLLLILKQSAEKSPEEIIKSFVKRFEKFRRLTKAQLTKSCN